MASPTFDGAPIFDSIDADDDNHSEGVLWVQDYTAILQTLHFEGENGSRRLSHGQPDRNWIFKGILSAPDFETLASMFNLFETYIDEIANDPSSYRTLTDSFGNSYESAQIHHFSPIDIRKTEDGYLAHVQVSGIVQGMVQENTGAPPSPFDGGT